MKIKFTKMQGLGNDYIFINCFNQDLQNIDIPDLAKKMSNRHFGIGSDGLVLIMPSKTTDAKMRIFNTDGSEAQMCGNAIRCMAKYLYDKNIVKKQNINIETLSGIKKIQIIMKEKEKFTAKVNMGKPIIDAKKIPAIFNKEKIIDEVISVNDEIKVNITCVSMGNPHCIVFVDDVNFVAFDRFGNLLENHKMFPERTNVEFVNVVDASQIQMRVWERGVGQTLACGTGACASVVACVLNNKTNRNIDVILKGGILNINWDEKDNCVYMTGPAEFVFEGEWNL